MRRITAAIVIGLLGVAITRLAAGDAYLSYVKPGMKAFLLIAGIGMVILALASAWDALRRDGVAHDHVPRVGLLLLVPFVAIFVIAPPPLGAYVAERSASNAISPVAQPLPPLPPGDPVPIALPDYVYRAQVDGGSSLLGRRVQVEGFVVPQGDGSWHLARIRIACCAADGLPYTIDPRGSALQAATADPNDWLRVVGTWAPGGADGVPLIEVESIEPIPPPVEPYA